MSSLPSSPPVLSSLDSSNLPPQPLLDAGDSQPSPVQAARSSDFPTTPHLPSAGVKRTASDMEPATPPAACSTDTAAILDAIAAVRDVMEQQRCSIEALRTDASTRLDELQVNVTENRDRLAFAEAQITSLEDRTLDTDQRCVATAESLRRHVDKCDAPPPAMPASPAVMARLAAVESVVTKLTHENDSLRALLLVREHTRSPSATLDSPPVTPSAVNDPQVHSIQNQVTQLSNRIAVLTCELREEERKRDNLEANSRLYNLEISGLPVTNEEDDNPMRLAQQIVHKVTNGRVRGDEVDVAHRKLGGPKNIILRFRSRTARDRVYAAKKSLRNVSRKEFGYATDGDIFLNESLTFDRSSLMRDVRAKVKSFNGGKVGAARCKLLTDRGVIKVKPPNQKYQKIFCLTDLEGLL